MLACTVSSHLWNFAYIFAFIIIAVATTMNTTAVIIILNIIIIPTPAAVNSLVIIVCVIIKHRDNEKSIIGWALVCVKAVMITLHS